MENNQNNQPQTSGTPQQFTNYSGRYCKFAHFRQHCWNPQYSGLKPQNDIFKYHGDPEYLGYQFNNLDDFPPHHFRSHKFKKHHGCHRHQRHFQNHESFQQHWNQRQSFMENCSKQDKITFIMSQPGGEDFLKKRQEFQNSWMSYRAQMTSNLRNNQPNQPPAQK